MEEKSKVPYDTISRLSVSTQSIFNKCCFCVPMRIGCMILGYLNLCINCIQMLSILALTTFIGLVTHGFDHIERDPSSTLYIKTNVNVQDDQKEQTLLMRIGYLLLILLLLNVVWLIINIACLVGLHKRRPGPILVYVGFASARLVLSIAVFIYLMFNEFGAYTFVTHGIDLGLSAYFILVYYIYAGQLLKEREAAIAQPAPATNVFIYPTKLDKSHLVA